SAALTAEVWGDQDIKRQVVHVIRQTRPEVLIGFSPAPAGHGHHQTAGRLIWEAAAAAADPTMYPEQLTGPDAVDVWQVKVITSGASTQGEGGTDGPQCNTGFVPAPTNPFTVVGTWSGYDSPYEWLPGNIQGQEPGTRSEEHTSELQSRENLVCRLLLEKKKKKTKNTTYSE